MAGDGQLVRRGADVVAGVVQDDVLEVDETGENGARAPRPKAVA
ncbi:hypothetical protein U8C32_21640 (plasmid) [Sinorhizobium medicae]|nr:hypothetical protein [Sinorhizobium medicae]WQO48047.1 hypothetical protein U8C42_21735 [Sinorhizobium medicae]WQO68404.1 hypothetical protein U8C40_23005 [Sinorhizobium medicae]WQO75464.1 hypothetical protein U8C31_22770 [Sinorhizobium medicae]WQO94657.1 hypothetical protein U8C32_21640 [Sinorhizobium medicae]